MSCKVDAKMQTAEVAEGSVLWSSRFTQKLGGWGGSNNSDRRLGSALGMAKQKRPNPHHSQATEPMQTRRFHAQHEGTRSSQWEWHFGTIAAVHLFLSPNETATVNKLPSTPCNTGQPYLANYIRPPPSQTRPTRSSELAPPTPIHPALGPQHRVAPIDFTLRQPSCSFTDHLLLCPEHHILIAHQFML